MRRTCPILLSCYTDRDCQDLARIAFASGSHIPPIGIRYSIGIFFKRLCGCEHQTSDRKENLREPVNVDRYLQSNLDLLRSDQS